MNNVMSSNLTKPSRAPVGSCTEFQMHKSQLTIFGGIMHKVLDFTEHKLEKYIDKIKDAQQKLVLIALLSDYTNGNVAIAWKRGQPIWIKISKD